MAAFTGSLGSPGCIRPPESFFYRLGTKRKITFSVGRYLTKNVTVGLVSCLRRGRH